MIMPITFQKRTRMTRRRLPVVVGLVLALASVMVGPVQSAQAAQGQRWDKGVPWAGVLQTNTGTCSVTVVSEFLAITAKHCGSVNPRIKLGVASASASGNEYAVKEIIANRDMDVQAIILRDRSGLTVTPLSTEVARDWFYGWGYGRDWSNRVTAHLTRADFDLPLQCTTSSTGGPPGLDPRAAEQGELCWQTTAEDSVCSGDSGGPVTQNGKIIAMMTRVFVNKPDDCSTVYLGQALTVKQMQPWLDQMIQDANPFP